MQKISHFERQTYDLAGSDRSSQQGAGITQNRRVFVIVLGRSYGWLPSALYGRVEGITRFLRERLLPGDYVGFCAWGRATDVTNDHEAIAQVVERLRTYQAAVERRRDVTVDQLGAYAFGAPPADPLMQAELDRVFEVDGASRRTAPLVSNREMARLLRRIGDHIWTVTGDSQAAKLFPGFTAGTSTWTIFNAIEWLRPVLGEKHLLFFTSGINLPSLDDDRDLARIASDARVAVHFITDRNFDVFSSLMIKNVSQLTGGQASINEYADRALAHVEEATRQGYRLGYYPSNGVLDGKYRRIEVRVRRPSGATALYRHSYQATDTPTTYDYCEFIAQDRIMAVREYDRQLSELPLKVSVSARKGTVTADALLDLSRVALNTIDGRRVGTLEAAFFCSDSSKRLIGQLWHKIELRLKEESYQRALIAGFSHQVSIPISGSPGYIQAIIYDYLSGRVGSVTVLVR